MSLDSCSCTAIYPIFSAEIAKLTHQFRPPRTALWQTDPRIDVQWSLTWTSPFTPASSIVSRKAASFIDSSVSQPPWSDVPDWKWDHQIQFSIIDGQDKTSNVEGTFGNIMAFPFCELIRRTSNSPVAASPMDSLFLRCLYGMHLSKRKKLNQKTVFFFSFCNSRRKKKSRKRVSYMDWF